MLIAKRAVQNYIDNFPDYTDNRKNKFYKKVLENKDYYIELVHMFLQGDSCRQIGMKLNIDNKYVSVILNKFKIDTSPKRMSKEDLKNIIIDREDNKLSLSELSKKYNYSMETIKRNLNNSNIVTSITPITNKLTDEIIELYKSSNPSEIAELYNVSSSTIKRFLESKNVKLRTLSQSCSLMIKKRGVNFKGSSTPFQSYKNKKWILSDSSYELSRFIELENDSSVLMYSKDVETISYNNNRNNYTADIYIRYSDGREEVEEIKPNWFLNYIEKIKDLVDSGESKEDISKSTGLSLKSINKFLLSDIKFKEAFEYFKKKNIKYSIKTEDNININLANYTCLTKPK